MGSAIADESIDTGADPGSDSSVPEDDSDINSFKKQVSDLYGQGVTPTQKSLTEDRYLARKNSLNQLADKLMENAAARRRSALDAPRFKASGEAESPVFKELPAPVGGSLASGKGAEPDVIISVSPVDKLPESPVGQKAPVEAANDDPVVKNGPPAPAAPQKEPLAEKKEAKAQAPEPPSPVAASQTATPSSEDPSHLPEGNPRPAIKSVEKEPSSPPSYNAFSESEAPPEANLQLASAEMKAAEDQKSLALLAPQAGSPKGKKAQAQLKHPAPSKEPEPKPLAEVKKNEAPNESASQIPGFADQLAAAELKKLIGGDSIPLNLEVGGLHADIQSPVHVDEAVAFALKKNFEVSAAEERSRGAYWDKMGAFGEYLPTVQLTADSGPERSQPASYNDSNGNRVTDSVHHRRDHSITISQPLIDLSIVADILSSRDKEEIANIDQKDVREGIAYDTASTYLSLLQARITVRLAEDYKKYLDDLSSRMKARVEGGGATNADLDRIRGRSTIAEGARVEAIGEYQTQLAEFNRLTKLIPPALVVPQTLAPVIPANVQEAMERALRANPTYMSSLRKMDLAADDRNKSISGLLPKLSFQYSNSYSYNAGGAAEGNPDDGVYPTQKTQNVMLVAQWQLTGGTQVTGTMSGMAKQREMNFRSLDVRSKIEQGIRSSYASINAGRERQAALQKTIEANERVVKGFEYQFANGGRSLFDLLDSYEQLYNSRLNYLRVTVASAKASYQVHRQMGELISAIVRDQEAK